MIITTQDLTKRYQNNVIACEKICLSVEEGQVFGLLGPNGAGKSTLVKMLLGLVRPTSGQALIKGKPVNNPDTRKTTGYLPELFRLYEWLTAEELLRFYARSYQIPARQQAAAIAEALIITGLKGREKEIIKGYSKGMQQRLALAGAILHHPDLVFLDEPTSALDPIGRRDIRNLIGVLKDRGTTILLNSHLLSEVELTCSHLGFINHGSLIAQGEIERFLQSGQVVTIQADNIDANLVNRWQSEHKVVESSKGKIVLAVAGQAEIPAIINELVARGARIYNVDSKSRALEEVFLDLLAR
ncbi:MAG: ABC transporter ATP-binding protein [Syntrophomonadaceae bacterium]|jgi:ABC-2 type transport system ATP-binding protein